MVQYDLRTGGRSSGRYGRRSEQRPDGEADQGSRGRRMDARGTGQVPVTGFGD